MRSRNSASFATPTYVRRDAASVSWGYFILTVVCACVLAAGFFLAAKQHFNTMDYGMKNSSLRKQVEDLQIEKRRLLLAREVSMSPNEIRRAAKNLGFRARGEVAVATLKTPADNLSAVKSADVVSPPVRSSDAPNPIKAFYPETASKPQATERSIKKIVMQKATRDEDRSTTATR